ncbi:MAG: DNA repair protein RadA [Actinomycetota bacterium]|nr:DNA repair protein RadA [Actinomycetota bacterium]
MARVRTSLSCSECGQPASQWAGRCPGCGAWGTIAERAAERSSGRSPGPGRRPTVSTLMAAEAPGERVGTGFAGLDRVLGGGLMPSSVVLLAGEPGIGKSTLLLHVMANLSVAGFTCLLASGEESRGQVATRVRRLGLDGERLSFTPGRELPEVLDAATAEHPFFLAVDSIQTVRDPSSPSMAGGPSQVRGCTDALVGLAKQEGITVLVTGHVTKDGDLAGPRTLEHAVDVVLSFEGDTRSGLRVLAGGKNRFGPEGEVAWFEMGTHGLAEVDPAKVLAPGDGGPGAATALPMAGRRALAVEVQALVVDTEGAPRRQAAGLDLRRFSLVAAVVDRATRLPLARAELYGASSGGLRIDDPGCDLAVAAALASAATGRAPPRASAFVGEVSLTGQVRPAPGMPQRLAAAKGAGITTVFAAGTAKGPDGMQVVPVRRVGDALRWAGSEGGEGAAQRPEGLTRRRGGR